MRGFYILFMKKLVSKISKGKLKGHDLFPHKHVNGKYVASPSKFEIVYVYVDNENELEALIKSGLSARMSNPDIEYNSPSLKIPKNINLIDGKNSELKPSDFLKGLIEDSDLDYDSKSKSRKEQQFLRAHLANGKLEVFCSICQNIFPLNFVIASHIKPRKYCEMIEKIDFDNIATFMCKTGCDDLYEKGYIYVDEGFIKRNVKRKTTDYLDKIISNLEGKKVKNWSNSKVYYDFHKKLFTE